MARGPKPRPVMDRINEKTVKAPCLIKGIDPFCWVFQGATLKGYGQIYCRGRTAYVHQVGYRELRGEVKLGEELDHLCRRPACWNPWHMEPVTHAENVRRGPGNRYRNKTHCPQWHAYTPENTYRSPGRNNRMCRTCRAEQSAHRYQNGGAERQKLARERRRLRS